MWTRRIGAACDTAEYHRKYSFQEEIRELPKRHRVSFDERIRLGLRPPISAALAGRGRDGDLPRAQAPGLFCALPLGERLLPC